MNYGKLFGWFFILGLLGYVAFSITQGQSGATGEAIREQYGEDVQVIRYEDCRDTDKGKEYRLKGQTYNIDENEVKEDYCQGEEKLVEYFCNNGYPDRISIPCNCEEGVCR